MTTDPDAPATLRNVAAMMVTVMGGQALAARSMHRDAADALQCMADEFHEIATAPAVATKSDQPATPAHLVPEGGLNAVIGPSRAGGPDHIGQAGERPATSPSPADPFAPMVEEALDAWHCDSAGSDEWRMRRALAAAIENMPVTQEMWEAGQTRIAQGDGPVDVFRSMTRALAAELRGKS